MWISEEGGGQPMWIRIFMCLGLFKSSFGLCNVYLVVFGLFLPKTDEKNHAKRGYTESLKINENQEKQRNTKKKPRKPRKTKKYLEKPRKTTKLLKSRKTAKKC